jgi:AcrR family transcriptional regulator
VPDQAQAPTGLGRRARRLPDEELQRRMLRAAAAMVHQAGLTVSLDHISFEDVIRDADVSRSAAYRRWPYKDLFYGDLVEELAKEGAPPGIVQAEYALIRQVVSEFPGELDTPGQRHELLTELFRQLALLDFQALADSPEWQTYVALQAAFHSIADAERRERVRTALAASEQERRARVAAAWELLADLFGYRIRPETGATFDTLITLVDATLRGLIIMAQPVSGIAASLVSASPFGATAAREWSLPALGTAGVATAFLEPDPRVEWDDERVARIRQLLSSAVPPSGSSPSAAPGTRR